MLNARALIEACQALEGTDVPQAELLRRRQALARHMRRVEKALARQLEHLAEAG